MTEMIQQSNLAHEYDKYGGHRLIAGVVEGQWATYRGIARLRGPEGDICATTRYFEGILPSVFVAVPLEVPVVVPA